MSNRKKNQFTIKVNDLKGHFWRAEVHPYENKEFSAGIVKGLEPDTVYLRIDRDDGKPTTIMLRPDEALAVLHVLSGALWSKLILEVDDKEQE